MRVVDLSLSGVKLIYSDRHSDERGSFGECYRKPLYEEKGIQSTFIQDNLSISKKGTIRGMHFQRSPGQAKLVMVLSGEIFDVVVDIRPDSPTFGKWEGVTLNAKENTQIYIPIGFAHGFCALSEEAHVFYKVSSLYNPEEEKGFRYDDPAVGIQWPLKDRVLSERDLKAPFLHEVGF